MKINLPAVRYAIRSEAPWTCLGLAGLLGWTAVTTGIPLVAAAVAPLAVVLALAALVAFVWRYDRVSRPARHDYAEQQHQRDLADEEFYRELAILDRDPGSEEAQAIRARREAERIARKAAEREARHARIAAYEARRIDTADL